MILLQICLKVLFTYICELYLSNKKILFNTRNLWGLTKQCCNEKIYSGSTGRGEWEAMPMGMRILFEVMKMFWNWIVIIG